MDDVAGGRGDVAEGVDVGHHVVPQLASRSSAARVEVDVVEVGAQLGELLGADARRDAVVGEQAEFVLGLGERQPQPPPGAELPQRPPPLGHLREA